MDFPIRLQPRLRPILLLFGVRPDNALVRLDEERLVARFGLFTAEAPLANIARWDITGPYRWWRGLGCDARSAPMISPSAGAPMVASVCTSGSPCGWGASA